MKIGLFHNLYGAFSHGGAETTVKIMIGDLKKEGHEVFLITTKPREATMENQETDFKIYYLNSVFYNLAKIPSVFRLFWHLGNIFSVGKYNRIKKILKTEKPNLIITHNLMGLGFLTPLAIKNLKINWEHFLHDIQLIYPSGLMLWNEEKKLGNLGAKIYRLLTRALFRSPLKVISPSKWLLEIHNRYGFFKNSQTEIRPFNWPKAKIDRQPNANGVKKFLFIGQIEKQKGIFLLINAFKGLPDPDLELTIAIRGGGRQTEAAKQAAASDKRIKFFGPLSYEEAEKIKAMSDCLIVPSLCYENSPTAIYGAHAVGLRVIAANLGGIPEIMKPNDILFKPGDKEDLRKKIMYLVK